MRKLLFTSILMLSMSVAFAGGYRVALQGQRMLGMGHAGLSVFENPETAFFNPAGISFLKDKFAASFGVNGILLNVKFQNELYNWQAQTESPIGTPFYLYLTYQAEDNVSIGLAVYTPFGSSAVWNKWAGSQIVRDISMQVIYIQPSIAYKFSDMFSASASFIMAYGNISYSKDINRYLTGDNGEKTYADLSSGWVGAAGYAFALAFKPSDKVSMGLNYRSKILLNAKEGVANFENVPSILSDQLTTTAFSAQLPMPAELGVGISVKPTDKLLLAFDYNYTYWSVYKQLKISFANGLPDNVSDKDWKNSNTFRLGAEYKLNDKMAVRAGYYFDQSPIPATRFSPETPSIDSDNFTIGFGYQMDKLSLDISLLYHKSQERTDYTWVNGEGAAYRFGGTYIANAIIPGFGLTYKIN